MKKTKKALVALVIGMVTVMFPFNTLASTGIETERLFGIDKIGTAIAVADKGWTTADTAILVPSADANLVDALAAAPLAGKTSPILLTDNNTLTDATKAELVKLGVKNVYVVGAISDGVVAQVNAIPGVKATALKGADRIATAVAISSKLIAPAGSFVVGYWALADALSVASYAAANNYSILLANPDGSLPASEAAYIGANVYIVGGPTLVADIAGATRLFGADRFATNQAVLEALTYKYDKVYVANGTDAHLVDSLVASSLAAKSGAPIVLCDTANALAATDIHTKLTENAVVTALGGCAMVPNDILTEVATGAEVVTPAQGNITGFKNSLFSSSTQVFLVTTNGTSTSYGTGSMYEKTDGQWKKLNTFAVRLGGNGISYTRMQNSDQTPAGVLNILSAFGIADNPSSNYAYHKVTSSDYWDLNSGSTTYNRMISSNPGGNLEHLIDFETEYKYGLVTDWNYDQSPNKGGAIFIHVNGSGATGSCISLTEGDMVRLIKWVDPARNPKVLVVPNSDLGNYFY